MPLRDHFHAPLHPTRPWESFHAAWANAIMDRLNQLLPPRYFAAIQVHLGSQVEADVAEFAEEPSGEAVSNGPGGGVATATWAPPKPALTVAATFPDDIEVQVFDTRDGAVLVAVVELVSPGNKDRSEKRRAFAAKAVAYLQRGVGLVVIDIVTSRQANLHHDVMDLLGHGEASGLPDDALLYVVAYRPARRDTANVIDIWPAVPAMGGVLPTMPLAVRGYGLVALELEGAYGEARHRSRL